MKFHPPSALLLATVLLLPGCGQKGPLTRPESSAQSPVVIRPAPQPATSPATPLPAPAPAPVTPPQT
jgi:predicted small lipoprotein YifL